MTSLRVVASCSSAAAPFFSTSWTYLSSGTYLHQKRAGKERKHALTYIADDMRFLLTAVNKVLGVGLRALDLLGSKFFPGQFCGIPPGYT